MQKSELKKLVFECFEKRRMEIIKKRNRFQQELDEDVHQLREAYGDAAVSGLGDLSLVVGSRKQAAPKGHQEEVAEPSQRFQTKRRRRRQQQGPTKTSLLVEHLPAAIEKVAAGKDEFTSRDVFEQLPALAGVELKHVSLYLARNAKKLGLVSEKRIDNKMMQGKPVPRPTNFFRQRKKLGPKKSRRS